MTNPWSSAPDVMDFLTTIWTTASAGTFAVKNGTVVSGEENDEGVIVGYANPAGVTVASGVVDPEGYEPSGLERYTINCAVKVGTGDEDYLPKRRRAFVILAALAAAVEADPRLGGRCMRARVAAWSLIEPPESVTTITVPFGVDVEGYTGG